MHSPESLEDTPLKLNKKCSPELHFKMDIKKIHFILRL